ncbi:MAG: putative iron-regulated membrane protein [Candidatus Azotimanducaceae bacterium]|jgi:uncharacterized iron-regulated membrane protein
MKIKWQKFHRKTHYWGALLCALPIVVVLSTGLLLQVKKQFAWIQPTTISTESRSPQLTFDEILDISKTIPEANITEWRDIERLDVQPSKGVIKVRSKNDWEVQLDQRSGTVLAVNYRRSDIIESIHDGSFFSDSTKLYIFLPAAIILFWLWISGMYLFFKTLIVRRKHKQKMLSKTSQPELIPGTLPESAI